MISVKLVWENVLFEGKLQVYAKNSNFENFESTLYMKSVIMPLSNDISNDCMPILKF